MSAIRSRTFAVTFALGGIALAGCIREEKFSQRRARALCEHAVDCGSFKSIADCMSVSPDEELYFEAAVEAGRIDYDAWAARECVRAIKGLECLRDEDESEVQEACAAVFTGKVAAEEPCYLGAECVGEASICAMLPNSCTADDACCPGVCRYIPDGLAEGDVCGGPARCGEKLHCALATPEEPQRLCAALPKIGEECPTNSCEEGAYCEEGTCAAKRRAGGACDHDGGCSSGYCVVDPLTESGECKDRAKTGQACALEEDCERVRDRCIDGTCTEPKIGDGCDEDDLESRCPDHARCHEGKCVSYRYEGETCDDDEKVCRGPLTCFEGGAFGRECALIDRSPQPEDVCPVPE